MTMHIKGSLIICGLGGQGIGLFGKILGEYYVNHGYEIKVSDVMGLGQRGGNVETHFRYAMEQIQSPLIPFGTADYLLSLEQTETLRNLHYLKEEGVVISSTFELSPPTVCTGLQTEIQGSKAELIQQCGHMVHLIDDQEREREDPDFNRVRNMILMGVFAERAGLDVQALKHILADSVPSRYAPLNLRAFEYGSQYLKGQQNANYMMR